MSLETYLVLTENEETASGHSWRDVTGERYQFPNKYRNIVVPGTRFIYYKGSRRAGGGRGEPQYFGRGVVGDVYLDPDYRHVQPAARKWISEIAEYTPFVVPVPFKPDGYYSELLSTTAASNWWGIGVRRIAEEAYRFILAAGGLVFPHLGL